MTKQLTTAIATDMVHRIEALKEQIEAVCDESDTYDGKNNSDIIRDTVCARANLRKIQAATAALLNAFDLRIEPQNEQSEEPATDAIT